MDLEIKSFSKEGIAIPSFLILTPPTQAKQQFHWPSRRKSKYLHIRTHTSSRKGKQKIYILNKI